MTGAQSKVLRFLDGNPAMMPRNVIDSCGLQPHAALGAMKTLVKLNMITETPGGSFEITDKGRDARRDES